MPLQLEGLQSGKVGKDELKMVLQKDSYRHQDDHVQQECRHYHHQLNKVNGASLLEGVGYRWQREEGGYGIESGGESGVD